MIRQQVDRNLALTRGWLNVAELARVLTYLEEIQILANSATKSPSRRWRAENLDLTRNVDL